MNNLNISLIKVTSAVGALAFLGSGGCAEAANLAITSLTSQDDFSAINSTETGTNPTTITYQNDITAVTRFTAGGNNYKPTGAADAIFIRRNAVNQNQSSLWSASTATAGTVRGPDQDNFGSLLKSNNLLTGTDNLFINSPNGVSSGNIERVDLVFSTGKAVTSTDALAVFDRGLVNSHDRLRVALITSLGTGLNFPLTWIFSSTVLITAANYGTVNPVANFDYTIGRYANGDNISAHTAMNTTSTQGIGGVAVPMSDLGVTTPRTIYGYALMGADVRGALANWNTAASYPTTTTAANGGVDAVAVNGIIFQQIPEPSSLGMALAGFGLLSLRRRPSQPTR